MVSHQWKSLPLPQTIAAHGRHRGCRRATGAQHVASRDVACAPFPDRCCPRHQAMLSLAVITRPKSRPQVAVSPCAHRSVSTRCLYLCTILSGPCPTEPGLIPLKRLPRLTGQDVEDRHAPTTDTLTALARFSCGPTLFLLARGASRRGHGVGRGRSNGVGLTEAPRE